MARLANAQFTIEFPETDDFGAEDIGFQIIYDEESKSPKYYRGQGATLVPQLQTGDINWTSLPPEQEINMPQTDWRKGMGRDRTIGSNWQRYLKADNCDASALNKIIPGPRVQQATGATLDGTPVRIFESASGVNYVAAGEKIYSLTSGTITEVWAGAGQTITDVAVLDKVYIALGGSNKFYFSSDMSTFTEASHTDSKADLFTVRDHYLGKIINPNEFRVSIDPSSSTPVWSVAEFIGGDSNTIGSSAYNVNWAEPYEGEWYFGKANGMWIIDTSGSARQLYKAPYISTNNYKPMLEWQGALYYPMGNAGFHVFTTTGGPVLISPALYARDARGHTGRPMAMAGDAEWLYVCTEPLSGESTKLLKVRLEDVDGDTDYRWHGAIAQIELDDVRHMRVFSPGVTSNPELWIAGELSGTPAIYYIVLPKNYSEIEDDGNYLLNPFSKIELSKNTKDLDLVRKAFFKLQIQSKNLSDTTTVDAEYKLDEDTDWTSLATYSESPQQDKEFAKDVSGFGVRLRLTLNGLASVRSAAAYGTMAYGSATYGGPTTVTQPTVTGVNIKARLETDELSVIDLHIRTSGAQKMSGGSISKVSSQHLYARLFELQSLNYPVKIWDFLTEKALYADVLSPTPETVKITQKGGVITEGVHLRFLEAPIGVS